MIYLDPADPASIHEAYTFKFTYPDGVASCQVEGRGALKSQIQNSTRDLLQAVLVMTEGLEVLPTTAYLAMRLEYYDDRTPEDYEPAGFQATELELRMEGGQSLGAGRVTTAHHGVRLRVRSGGRREILGGGAALVEDEYLSSQLTQSQAQSQLAADVPQDSTVSCVCGSRHRDSLMLQCLHCSQQQQDRKSVV